jgi:pyruvate/2-oxoglutarate dehydrogenase complex dihydrolipoamide dehydrogenase (E3) component
MSGKNINGDGASQGIGAALVEAFLKEVVTLSMSAASPSLLLVNYDIGQQETAAKAVDAAIRRCTTTDVLVNNAGSYKRWPSGEERRNQGFHKDSRGDSKQILGATILGTGGDEVIHCVLDMMYAKAEYTVMQRAVHIHPTVAEQLPTILGELRPLTAVAPNGTQASG